MVATCAFPELHLPPSAGHKLRGYFGTLFREHSPLLHNHYEDGRTRQGYPLVQYKVLGGVPTLVGLGEGAALMSELFLRVGEITLDGRTYPVREKNLTQRRHPVGVDPDGLYEYRFQTRWMALNQRNYAVYQEKPPAERPALLTSILKPNILAFFTAVGHRESHRIVARTRLRETHTQFKNQRMLAFLGTFTTNARLPDGIGLGKSAARGYGAIRALDVPTDA
ncbi:MAG: CRISPR-associated endonuclease Cas6 [Catalinimonas sp.]